MGGLSLFRPGAVLFVTGAAESDRQRRKCKSTKQRGKSWVQHHPRRTLWPPVTATTRSATSEVRATPRCGPRDPRGRRGSNAEVQPVYPRLAAQMREHQPRIDAVHRMPAPLRRRYEHRTLRSLRNDPLVSAYTRQVGASQSQTASCRSREHRPGATRRASSSSSSSSSDPGDPDGEPHHRGPRHISRAITAFLAEVVA